MSQIPPEVVEATWQRIGALDEPDLVVLQARSGRVQPELTGFVLGFTSELAPDALGLSLYAMVVVYDMFRTHHVKMRKARDRTVLRHWAEARDQVDSLRDRGVTREQLVTTEFNTPEPFVLRYVLEAFTEQHDDDPISIGDDELWHVVAVFLAVVGTLHEMAGAERLSV